MADDKRENDCATVVYATFPSREAAEEAAGRLVDAGLAACVNLIPGMVAIYRWQGERHRDSEVVMIAKSRASLAERVVAAIRDKHPYTNPAVVHWPIAGGSRDYLDWVLAETQGGDRGAGTAL
jgi:periplasmic divalent cation tolerance protein